MGLVGNAPQFGVPIEGVFYRERPCVYGIAVDFDGRLAIAEITNGCDVEYDLPGGGIDIGETEVQALEREFREETGLIVRAGPIVARAGQYWMKPGTSPRNAVSTFRLCTLAGALGGSSELDHRLVWRDPIEAALSMRHEAHAWAILAWLRANARE